MAQLSRRQFIQTSVLLGASLATGCGGRERQPSPTPQEYISTNVDEFATVQLVFSTIEDGAFRAEQGELIVDLKAESLETFNQRNKGVNFDELGWYSTKPTIGEFSARIYITANNGIVLIDAQVGIATEYKPWDSVYVDNLRGIDLSTSHSVAVNWENKKITSLTFDKKEITFERPENSSE